MFELPAGEDVRRLHEDEKARAYGEYEEEEAEQVVAYDGHVGPLVLNVLALLALQQALLVGVERAHDHVHNGPKLLLERLLESQQKLLVGGGNGDRVRATHTRRVLVMMMVMMIPMALTERALAGGERAACRRRVQRNRGLSAVDDYFVVVVTRPALMMTVMMMVKR